MKRMILSFLAFMVYVICYAQAEPTLKPLHRILKTTKLDSLKIDAQLKISEYYSEKSQYAGFPKAIDSAKFYAQTAAELSTRINNKILSSKSYVAMSKALYLANHHQEALEIANKAISVLGKSPDKTQLASAYVNLGNTITDINLPAKVVAFEKALSLYRELGIISEQAKLLEEIGYFHMGLGKIENGIGELKESLALYQSIGFKAVQRICSLIGIGYCEMGDFKPALEYGLMAVKIAEEVDPNGPETPEIYNYLAKTYGDIKDLNMSRKYFHKAYTASKRFNNPTLVIMIENNLVKIDLILGYNAEAVSILKKMEATLPSLPITAQTMIISTALNTYTKVKDYKNAEVYAIKSLQMIDSAPELYQNTLLYGPLLEYYFQSKKYDLLRKYGKSYLKISEQNKNLKAIAYVHRVLFRLDSVQSNFNSAVKHMQLEKKYTDSLFSIAKNEQLTELQIKYDTEKKDKDLLQKDKNLLLKEETNKTLKRKSELINAQYEKEKAFRNFGLVIFFLMLVISILFYTSYKAKKRSSEVLTVQKNEIDQQNSLLQKLVKEKEWLLKEVHHRVKNNLQMVISLLTTQSYYLKDSNAISANKDNQNRIHSMSLIHKKLYQTENIVSINMNSYISELIEQFKSSYQTRERIRFELEIANVELDSLQAIPLGLIINEVVTNAIKHAFPDERQGIIWVALTEISSGYLKLNIRDNGIGIATDNLGKNTEGFGTNLIRGLSGDLHGTLDIATEQGVDLNLIFQIINNNNVNNS